MDDIQEENQVATTDGASAAAAPNGLDAFSDTVDDIDDTSEDGMVKKLKRELQCTVCHQIPTSIPIPSCPMGHILCRECKEKIVYSRLIRGKPCPLCRSPLDRNTSYLASTLISFFSDIPCSYKNSGCDFQGNLENLKTHLYQFKIVECYVLLKYGKEAVYIEIEKDGRNHCPLSYPISDFYLLKCKCTSAFIFPAVLYIGCQS
jgi:hypothetical protein